MKIIQSIMAIFFALMIFHNAAYAKTKIKKIGFTNSNRLYIEIDNKAKYKVFALKNPNRIVVDVFGATTDGVEKPKYIKNVKDVRYSTDSKKARIVFDLTKSIKISSSAYSKLKGDKYGRITIATSASTKIEGVEKEYQPVIVIDAGHGGKDPGALGRYLRTKEKIITLSYAKELYRTLKKSGKYKVYMTRKDDKFLPLKSRVRKARKLKADLFISLHANTSPNRNAKGFSVYTLSEKASDKEAEKLAAKENRAGGADKVNFNANADILRTLIDLSQRNSMNHSSRFADLAVNKIKRQKIDTIHNSHRFAGFVVLTAPDMVSVLIEIGYLSNKNEEKNLNSIYHKRKITRGIKDAIDEYFKFKN